MDSPYNGMKHREVLSVFATKVANPGAKLKDLQKEAMAVLAILCETPEPEPVKESPKKFSFLDSYINSASYSTVPTYSFDGLYGVRITNGRISLRNG